MRDKIDTRMLFENLQRFQDSLQEQEDTMMPAEDPSTKSGFAEDSENELLDIAKKLVECLENQDEEEAYKLCKELHSKFRKKTNDNDVEFN